MRASILACAFFGSLSAQAAKRNLSCAPGEWVALAPIPEPRQEHGTAAMGDHSIAILGGILPTINGTTTTTDLFQIYDIAENNWRTASSAPVKVNHPNVAAVSDKLYLLGGLIEGPTSSTISMNWTATGASYVYNTNTDTWSQLPPMPSGTERGSSIVGVYQDLIILAGGMTVLMTGNQDAVNSVISFNTTTETWQKLPAPDAAELPGSRQHGSGGVVGSIFHLVGGRRYSQLNYRDTVFRLDLSNASGVWETSTGRLPTARGGLSGAAVGAKFYAFGGEGCPDTTTGVFNQTDVFDTETQKWTELDPMQVPRHGTQAASAGRIIYIPGGGLQQDGKTVVTDGIVTYQQPTSHFDAFCT